MRAAKLLAALPLLLASGLANAEAADAASGDSAGTEVDEIIVKGRTLSIDKLNSVKTPTPIIDVPQSLSITTSEQIQQQSFQSIGDVLRYTPGLSVSQGEGHRDAIIIRGIQTTADFFVDGIRDDVQYYRPLYNVAQIEVLRGSNALLFGRGGGGGVINRVQKQANLDSQFTSIIGGVDSFGAYTTSVDTNFVTSDNSALRVNAYYQSLENHRDFYEGESFAINPTFKLALSDVATATFSYEYIDDDRGVDRGVPSQNVDGGPDVPLVGYDDTFFGSARENFTTLEANLFRARLDHEFSEVLRGNLTAQFADYDKLYQNLYASEEVFVTNGVFGEVELDGYLDTTARENMIIQANLVAEFATGGIDHTLLFGIELGDQETENARRDNVFADNGADQLVIPFTDPLQVPAFAFSNPVRDRASEVSFASIYLQDQLDLTGNFKLVAGLRYDEFDIDVLDIIEQNNGDAIDGNFTRKDSEVTPRLGLIYKPAENMSIYASYSETFLPRSGDQFLTLSLDSESTRPQFFENREVGVKWDIREDLSVTAALFELERESYTSVDPEDPAQLIVVEGSETSGFELELAGRLTDFWTITAGYANLDGVVLRVDGTGNSGNVTRQTPDNMFSIWNTFTVNDSLSFAFGANYQDSFFIREDNSVEVPGYTRVDAAAYYDVSDRLRLQLNVENLLDEDYYPDAHSNDNITTGEPANARITAIYTF
ncbi:MAG: TonB-dependent siderophore receptor [Woeseiaceae bacterium]|nr:TonB-dependent siderophore receptor [Woeseiaceae bacterium]